MLAYIDRIASCSWWGFVGCTSRARSSRFHHILYMHYWVEIWWLWRPF